MKENSFFSEDEFEDIYVNNDYSLNASNIADKKINLHIDDDDIFGDVDDEDDSIENDEEKVKANDKANPARDIAIDENLVNSADINKAVEYMYNTVTGIESARTAGKYTAEHEKKESELDSPHKHFLQIDELEIGKRYCAYVTTYAGLFRYNMNDLVEVGGKYYETPTVHMVSKVNGIVSLTGEKLYEPQFMDAVHQAEDETEIKTKFFVGFADVEESKYHFYYEFENPKISQEQAEEFTKVVDEKLQHINLEYESKRQSFRLQAPEAHILLSNAYARFKAACLKDGFRDGQFKFNLLMQDEKRRSRFNLLLRLESGFERFSEGVIDRADKIDERRKERAKRRQAKAERRSHRG